MNPVLPPKCKSRLRPKDPACSILFCANRRGHLGKHSAWDSATRRWLEWKDGDAQPKPMNEESPA